MRSNREKERRRENACTLGRNSSSVALEIISGRVKDRQGHETEAIKQQCTQSSLFCSEAVKMSREQLDSVASRMESLLSVAMQLQAQCREQSVQLAVLTAQLREEAENLRQQSSLAEQDMAEMHKTLEELMDTKVAFEAKERQARKLSKQL